MTGRDLSVTCGRDSWSKRTASDLVAVRSSRSVAQTEVVVREVHDQRVLDPLVFAKLVE